jgi:membrane-associated phospholipid phosphatase
MREVYAITTALTPAQRRIARRWEGRRGTRAPSGLWNDIALRILREEGVGAGRAARILAALDTAQADAMIAAWHAKYRWWTESPVTYIRREIDPDWMPPLRTPNFPGYVSGHSTTSAAAAEVLSAAFPARRSELRTMAEEAGMSRIFGGIHTRSDHEAGARLGRRIGRAAVRAWLR